MTKPHREINKTLPYITDTSKTTLGPQTTEAAKPRITIPDQVTQGPEKKGAKKGKSDGKGKKKGGEKGKKKAPKARQGRINF